MIVSAWSINSGNKKVPTIKVEVESSKRIWASLNLIRTLTIADQTILDLRILFMIVATQGAV